MKKRTWVMGFGGLMAAGSLTMGVLTAGAAVNGGITEDRAKEIAVDHSGVKEEEISYSRVNYDRDDNRSVYEVDLYTTDYRKYEYKIGTEDGAVLDFEYDGKASFLKRASQEDRKAVISDAKAKEIALNNAGKKETDVVFVKAELEYDDGIAVYDVEFYGADFREYDYEISAGTGEIIGLDYDAENFDGKKAQSGTAAGEKTTLTVDQVKEKVFGMAGVSASQVKYLKMDQEWDDGRLVYEGEFVSGTTEYEFEIDGETGTMLDWSRESIYD